MLGLSVVTCFQLDLAGHLRVFPALTAQLYPAGIRIRSNPVNIYYTHLLSSSLSIC